MFCSPGRIDGEKPQTRYCSCFPFKTDQLLITKYVYSRVFGIINIALRYHFSVVFDCGARYDSSDRSGI